MLKKLRILVLVLTVIAVTLFSKGAMSAQVEEFNDYYSVTFPAGTYFSVVLQQPIDSSINKIDDLVEAIFTSDYYIDELLVIPEGSSAIGRIVYIERAHMGRNALVNIQFISIIGVNNAWETPVSASIIDKNSDGSIGGNLTPRTQVKLITHQVEHIGAYNQALETGPRAMGQEIYIAPGERWVITLNKPTSFIVPK
ncbi:MAG: hypothetical protein AB7V50_04680 [Vampirovibrionia bacterium]